MGKDTIALPVQDRALLAFSELLDRLAVVEPDIDVIYPTAFDVAGKWTVAGESQEDVAASLSVSFIMFLLSD